MPAFIPVAHIDRVIDTTTPWERKNVLKIKQAAINDALRMAAEGEWRR
jgi:hypothetical protein